MAWIANTVPAAPEGETLAPGRPVYGRQAMTIADAVNGLNGYKFLRAFTQHVELADFTDDDATSARGIVRTIRSRFYIGPVASDIWIGYWFISEPSYGGFPTTITARLQTLTAAPVGNSITWSSQSTPGLATVGFTQTGATEGADAFTSTGWQRRDPATSQPGLLDVSTSNGAERELVTTISGGVRIYSISIVEVYRSQIP